MSSIFQKAEPTEQSQTVTEADTGEVSTQESNPPAESTEEVVYSSHPIPRFCVGRYQFEKSTLKLTPEQAEKFDKLVEGLPERDRAVIRKIDAESASQLALKFLDSKRIRGVDTSKERPEG